MFTMSTSGSGKTCEMDRNTNKKSKVKGDRSAKDAIYQLLYDFLKRDDGTCEVAELLKKKTKLVWILSYVEIHCTPLDF